VSVDALNGRVAATDVAAPVSLPPFASSAMDGYAFRAGNVAEGDRLRLVGASLAGHPFNGILRPHDCIRITTGAAVPDSADTVVIQENTSADTDTITLLEVPAPGANIRTIGHDVHAGQTVIHRGQQLNPMAVGWIAACGITEASVYELPRVAVFSTGDELASPGTPLQSGQIYDSNRFAVAALLEALPARVTNLGILPDQPNAIEGALSAAARSHDLILTSGGVSVGDADYVKDVVESLGALELWRMNMKPGKPLAFGRVADTLFLGLPGNPVSTIVTFLLIARPLVLTLAGTEPTEPLSITAELEGTLRHNPGREEYQRGVMRVERGKRKVRVSGDQSSNRMATFSGADCLIRIPKQSEDVPPGAAVEVLPLQGLLR
jgi:molybdopterin molybdotransferase